MSDYLHSGDLGIDYSSYRLNPPNAAVADGAKFVLRYSAGIASRPSHSSYPANKPKLITPAEYAQLDPFYVMLANSEWYEGRVTEGDAAGFADGQADYELWQACGYPQGYPVFCSWDTYPNATDIAGVAAYLKAHQRGMDTAAGERYYVTDLYAGENGIRAMRQQGLAPIGWRTMASSWNDFIPASQTVAAIVQTGNYWYGNQADENVMARDLALGGGIEDDMTPDESQKLTDLWNWFKARPPSGQTNLGSTIAATLPIVQGNYNKIIALPTAAQIAAAVAKVPGEIKLTDEQLVALAAELAKLVPPDYHGEISLSPKPAEPTP